MDPLLKLFGKLSYADNLDGDPLRSYLLPECNEMYIQLSN